MKKLKYKNIFSLSSENLHNPVNTEINKNRNLNLNKCLVFITLLNSQI